MANPALPPGFVLEDDDAPLPPGFVLVDASKPKKPESDLSRLITGNKKPRTAMEEVGRQAKLTGRYLMSGPLEFAGMFTDPLANVLGLPTARQGAQAAGDSLGLPNPEGKGERIVAETSKAVAGGAGLLGLSNVAARSPGLIGSVGNAMSTQPGLQGLSAATGSASASTARENGATPGWQIAAGIAGGLAPSAIAFGGPGATRYLLRGGEDGRLQTERGIQDFTAAGATPSVGQATGNKRTQGLESLLAGGPTSNGVMTRFAEQQAQKLGTGLQGQASRLSPAPSAERAGLAVERGVGKFTGDVKSQREALYSQADSLIPATTASPLSNTWQTLRSLTTPNPGAPATTAAMVNPKIASLFETVGQDLAASGGKGLPYQAVKDIRSKIGAELSDFSLTTDKPTAQYKALYAALSRDMEEAAKAQGPDAYAAAQRASNYFKASQARLETLERVVDKAGGPEKIYQAALAGTTDGATTLRAVMRSLPADGQKALTAAVVKRMGLATKGNQNVDGDQFSAQSFLTNWNALSKEARGALFSPHGVGAGPFNGAGKFVSDMDKIARVAERIRDGSRVYANPSGTANKGLAYAYLGSLATSFLAGPLAVGGVVASGVAANGMARVMTNPRFVGWLARSTELPASSAPQQIAALRAIAQTEKDEDLAAIADQLEQEAKQPKR